MLSAFFCVSYFLNILISGFLATFLYGQNSYFISEMHNGQVFKDSFVLMKINARFEQPVQWKNDGTNLFRVLNGDQE